VLAGGGEEVAFVTFDALVGAGEVVCGEEGGEKTAHGGASDVEAFAHASEHDLEASGFGGGDA
jgi:hypothetical protein